MNVYSVMAFRYMILPINSLVIPYLAGYSIAQIPISYILDRLNPYKASSIAFTISFLLLRYLLSIDINEQNNWLIKLIVFIYAFISSLSLHSCVRFFSYGNNKSGYTKPVVIANALTGLTYYLIGSGYISSGIKFFNILVYINLIIAIINFLYIKSYKPIDDNQQEGFLEGMTNVIKKPAILGLFLLTISNCCGCYAFIAMACNSLILNKYVSAKIDFISQAILIGTLISFIYQTLSKKKSNIQLTYILQFTSLISMALIYKLELFSDNLKFLSYIIIGTIAFVDNLKSIIAYNIATIISKGKYITLSVASMNLATMCPSIIVGLINYTIPHHISNYDSRIFVICMIIQFIGIFGHYIYMKKYNKLINP